MTPALRKAMMDEPRLFFESIVRENESGSSGLWTATYTFLNEPLAELYGLEQSCSRVSGCAGSSWRIPTGAVSSGCRPRWRPHRFPNRTSPVRRGVWVLEQILGERVPPPPPDVPELDEQEPKSVEGLTLRQRTELHTTDPVCANCHRVLDPIGFGLENFDAIGRWRREE